MNVFLIIFFILLLLLFFPITLRGSFKFDVSQNMGDVLLQFFKIKVYMAKVSFSTKEVTLTSQKRALVFPFSGIKNGGDFKTRFLKNLAVFAKYNNARILGSVGIVNNAMASSLTCGLLNIFSGGALSFATNKLNIKNYTYEFFPSFLMPTMDLYLSSSITINLAVVLYSAIYGL